MAPRRGLLRLLGVAFGVAVAVGNTIGSGILKTPGEVATLLPRPSLFIGVWALGGLYAFLSALSIAELVVIGEYLALLVSRLHGAATILAVAVTVIFALLQIRGVRVSGRVQEVTSLLKTIAFALLVIACFALGHGVTQAASPAPQALPVAIVIALQAVIFTYDGWTGVIYFSEEVKDPAGEVPRALFLGVGLIAAIYLLVNLALVHVAPLAELAGSTLAVGVAAGKLFGAAGDPVIRWLTVLSMIAAINAYHLMASRVLFGLARDGLFFGKAAEVNRGGTPVPALLLSTAVAVGFILSGTFEQVIAVLSFFFVANYAVSFLSLLVLRRREPQAERPFRVPLYPLLTLLTLAGSLAFLGGSIAGDPGNSLFVLLLLVASAPVYLLLKRAAIREL